MRPDDAPAMAQAGRLYPAVIVHGGEASARRDFTIGLARTLLCEGASTERPCGECKHCERIAWPEKGEIAFHPDLYVLERDLKTSTSIEGAKSLVEAAQVSPYEARGQVFVIAEAETLTPAAANSLLKTLEEPYDTSPRHFFLLAPSQFDLLPTLRSRSLALFLGARSRKEGDADLTAAFGAAITRYQEQGNPVFLLAAAGVLVESESWDDSRDTAPWNHVAESVSRAGLDSTRPAPLRRALLALAEELTQGWRLRTRGVPPQRIVEGLLSKHLASS